MKITIYLPQGKKAPSTETTTKTVNITSSPIPKTGNLAQEQLGSSRQVSQLSAEVLQAQAIMKSLTETLGLLKTAVKVEAKGKDYDPLPSIVLTAKDAAKIINDESDKLDLATKKNLFYQYQKMLQELTQQGALGTVQDQKDLFSALLNLAESIIQDKDIDAQTGKKLITNIAFMRDKNILEPALADDVLNKQARIGRLIAQNDKFSYDERQAGIDAIPDEGVGKRARLLLTAELKHNQQADIIVKKIIPQERPNRSECSFPKEETPQQPDKARLTAQLNTLQRSQLNIISKKMGLPTDD